MTRRTITTSHAPIACDVCGRTLLRGEHADVFLHGGARRMVCELCTQRASHEGWIREGLDDAVVRGRAGTSGRSFLGRLAARRRAEPAAGADETDQVPEPAPGMASMTFDDPEPAYDEAYAGVQDVVEEQAERPAREPRRAPLESREPRSVRAVPTNADLKVARALDVFNASEHPRTVAGVARSLGEPIVSVRPSSTEGSVVTIVVGWELSWYRYEVDLGNEAAGVRVVAQGMELGELEPGEQDPNAAADALGGLHLAGALE